MRTPCCFFSRNDLNEVSLRKRACKHIRENLECKGVLTPIKQTRTSRHTTAVVDGNGAAAKRRRPQRGVRLSSALKEIRDHQWAEDHLKHLYQQYQEHVLSVEADEAERTAQQKDEGGSTPQRVGICALLAAMSNDSEVQAPHVAFKLLSKSKQMRN